MVEDRIPTARKNFTIGQTVTQDDDYEQFKTPALSMMPSAENIFLERSTKQYKKSQFAIKASQIVDYNSE